MPFFIEEFPDVPQGGKGSVATLDASKGNIVPQSVVVDGTERESNVFANSTNYVRYHTTQECYYDIGETPEASATKFHLPENVILTLKVKPGHKFDVVEV
jgi:hypothetical protein